MKRHHFVAAAGALYLGLAVVLGIVLARWVIAGVPEAISFAQGHPQFIHTFVGVPALAAISITLAALLLWKGPGRGVVVLSILGAGLGALLGWFAVVLWLVPVPFVIGGYRSKA
jgi:cytosine/uracil/thiamine/allantoin permease